MARTRTREQAVVMAAALGASALLLGGCASTPLKPRVVVRPAPVRDAGPLVFPTDRVAAAEAEMGVEAQYAWFAYGRNDGEVSARYDVPIEATRQWPVPPKPAERHVRFWYWVQR